MQIVRLSVLSMRNCCPRKLLTLLKYFRVQCRYLELRFTNLAQVMWHHTLFGLVMTELISKSTLQWMEVTTWV